MNNKRGATRWDGSKYVRNFNPKAAETFKYPKRKVVGEVEVPYDRDAEGKVLTVIMDILECGHRAKKSTNQAHWNNANADALRRGYEPVQAAYHHCRKCPKESA